MSTRPSHVSRIAGSVLLLMLVAGDARAQVLPRVVQRSLAQAGFDTTRSILENGVPTLHAAGDTLWAGPFLSLTPNGGETWLVADADSTRGTRNDVFSLDVEGNVVVAGLRYVTEDPCAGSSRLVNAGGGLLISRDGGQHFEYVDPPLDTPLDTTVAYGNRRIPTLLDNDKPLSPPYALDYVPETHTIWVAAGEGGIRRSSDFGESWQRAVLPPDDRFAIAPDSAYSFVLGAKPCTGDLGNRNHSAYSVLVDEQGTIWAGTAAGLNRSTDGGESWHRFIYDGTANGLTGDFVWDLDEQPKNGTLWIASWSNGLDGGNYGITVTHDGGRSFQPVRLTEGASNGGATDFAFRGDMVYVAAGTNGLFSSRDGGQTWTAERTFGRTASPFVSAVATTGDAVWAGTSQGLFKSTDGGDHWRLFQVEVPLDPDEPTAQVPKVETFAYPNPFSPSLDRRVRIRYDATPGESAKVRIFDFNMNLVRTLRGTCQGDACSIGWNGTDGEGLRVANGAYFYVVEAGGSSAKGKILILQ